jgi:hypothetical protein
LAEVPTSDNYRRYAALVRGLASKADGEAERGALLELAGRWDALANYKDKQEQKSDYEHLAERAERQLSAENTGKSR